MGLLKSKHLNLPVHGTSTFEPYIDLSRTRPRDTLTIRLQVRMCVCDCCLTLPAVSLDTSAVASANDSLGVLAGPSRRLTALLDEPAASSGIQVGMLSTVHRLEKIASVKSIPQSLPRKDDTRSPQYQKSPFVIL